jgi:hypothetical protein
MVMDNFGQDDLPLHPSFEAIVILMVQADGKRTAL